MKCILHIGMPKTGTTSLQSTLGKNRSHLERHGVLYPELSAMRHAHHLLMPLFIPANHCWGRVKQQFGFDEASLIAGAQREWDDIKSQVRKTDPKTLVISTEALFVPIREKALQRFRDLLLEIADSVSIVSYVRSPSSYYRSILLERAKRSSQPRPPEPISYQRPIEQFESVFSTKAKVRKFSRQDLLGKDVNTDFFSCELDLTPEEIVREGNRSLSPEAMEIYQDVYRDEANPKGWLMGAEQKALLRILGSIEKKVGSDRSTPLKDAVSQRIEAITTETAWLFDRYGIDFSMRSGSNSGDHLDVRGLRDAFEMDDDYRSTVVSELITTADLSEDVIHRLRTRAFS